MELNQMEQEAIVIEQLEWLINDELKKQYQDLDHELLCALSRVLQEFKVIK